MNEKILELFWANVNKTNDCWNWLGKTSKSGAPIIRFGPRTAPEEYYPRRISLQIEGRTLDKAVFPFCQNKLCVNPDHLVSGDTDRFWSKVIKYGPDDCWLWYAHQDKDRYGRFTYVRDGKKIHARAHVYSWELYVGRRVIPSLQVCHRCDNPSCVNPAHLFLGTTQDNTQDKFEKGRQAMGESHGRAKLTEADVKEIRKLFATGNYTKQKLSDLFGVVRSVIGKIVNNQLWTHVQ